MSRPMQSHCKRGHSMDDAYWVKDSRRPGGMRRECRECKRTLQRATHCKRGHEWTPENTIVESGGRRRCRECRNSGTVARRTHCREGHPLTGDNLLANRQQRRCRICYEAYQAAVNARRRAATVAREKAAAAAVVCAAPGCDRMPERDRRTCSRHRTGGHARVRDEMNRAQRQCAVGLLWVNDGLSMQEIAARVGCSWQTVAQDLEDMEIRPRQRKSPGRPRKDAA